MNPPSVTLFVVLNRRKDKNVRLPAPAGSIHRDGFGIVQALSTEPFDDGSGMGPNPEFVKFMPGISAVSTSSPLGDIVPTLKVPLRT